MRKIGTGKDEERGVPVGVVWISFKKTPLLSKLVCIIFKKYMNIKLKMSLDILIISQLYNHNFRKFFLIYNLNYVENYKYHNFDNHDFWGQGVRGGRVGCASKLCGTPMGDCYYHEK